MDLGTVVANVQQGVYADAGEALQDVRLVWRNCHSFNEPGSDVYKACDELAGFVDQLWRQARLSCPPPVRSEVALWCTTACVVSQAETDRKACAVEQLEGYRIC